MKKKAHAFGQLNPNVESTSKLSLENPNYEKTSENKSIAQFELEEEPPIEVSNLRHKVLQKSAIFGVLLLFLIASICAHSIINIDDLKQDSNTTVTYGRSTRKHL